jgi:co-chaperonin GroES (HSP10)
MKQKIEPRLQYILVKPDVESITESEYGLIMPSNVEQEQKSQGEVISVSQEIKDIKKGDQVVYGAYSGEEMKTRENGKEVTYKLLHNDDVIAFIRE